MTKIKVLAETIKLERIVIAIIVAVAITAVATSGWLDSMDLSLSDAIYQRAGGSDGEIIVVGLDQQALDELGPMPWPRSYVAEAIEYLNSDPDSRPAVIGVDVLYVGEGNAPDADALLVEASEEYGNVVFAAAATFGSEIVVNDDDSFYLDQRAVVAWDEPFEALKEVSQIGHINASIDTDGILRHALLRVAVSEENIVYSFSRIIYNAWCQYHGIEPNPLPETDGNGFFYIKFTGAPGEYYESISLVDLLNGDIEPDYFEGKVVLIGPYAAGMQDEYATSVEHAETMYGIEIQANLIDMFREGAYKKEASDTPQLVLLFLACAGLVYAFWDAKMRTAIAAWLGVFVTWLVASIALYQSGIILHVLWLPLASTVIFIASVAVNYTRAAREKRAIQNTFQHYVDPAVMKELLTQGESALRLGGDLKDIAVLFVDIRGFTTMSEALDPPTVVEIINKYLTLTTDCIMRNHGTLDKFVGDCTMAFWNAPVAQEDAVYMACRAAMDMVEGSVALGQELQERFGRTVSFGVGVNWGPAVVGNIGAPKRMDYTAIGDTVNTAARLEANAPGGKILISRAVADILGERAEVTSLGGTIKLKGKAEGFEILTLDALHDDRPTEPSGSTK